MFGLHVFFSLAIFTPSLDSNTSTVVEPKCCGRYALSLIANYLDEGVPCDAWGQALPSELAPFSVAQLEIAAKNAGFEVISLIWNDRSLADFSIPCVLHVTASPQDDAPNHFIACFGCVGDKVLVGDYPGRPRLISRSLLLRVWSGTVLYVGRPGAGDLNHFHWQIRMEAARPFLWLAFLGGLVTFSWLVFRIKAPLRPNEPVPPPMEAASE